MSEHSTGHELSKQSGASERVSGANKRANGRASGPVLTSLFLFVPDHSASVSDDNPFFHHGLSSAFAIGATTFANATATPTHTNHSYHATDAMAHADNYAGSPTDTGNSSYNGTVSHLSSPSDPNPNSPNDPYLPSTAAIQTTDDGRTVHYGTKPGYYETSNHSLSHERGSERSDRASERVSAAEGASEASSPEQANE